MSKVAAFLLVTLAGRLALATDLAPPDEVELQPARDGVVTPTAPAAPPVPLAPAAPAGAMAPPASKAKSSKKGGPEVLFTFDDGPAIDKTPKILDTLDRHGVKAIFFVNGWHLQGKGPGVEHAKELLREELRRGHLVGNHTIHHYFLCGHHYVKQAREEIEGNAKLIEEATGSPPPLFRTPYGAHCKQLAPILHELGIKPIGWDIDPQDWRVRDAPKIVAFVKKELSTLRGRAILLLHDVQGATVTALPEILDWIAEENTRRVADGRAPIKIIDYSYLLPKRDKVPPLLDALGRTMVDFANLPFAAALQLWPGALGSLACPTRRV